MFGRLLNQFLDSPLSGMTPWVLVAMLSGPGRFEPAVSGALGVSLMVLVLSWRRGITVHVIEFFGVSYFVVLAIIGLGASSATRSWLELWSGDITNAWLALFAAVTLLIRRPYTMVYRKHVTPPEHWGTELFVRVNMTLTSVWAGAFAFSATVGFLGDALWHDTDNFWTGWILQLAALLFAVAFTEFYPEWAQKRAEPDGGAAVPSWVRLVEWLPPFVLATGIAGWLLNAVADVGCLALVVAGAVGGEVLRRRSARAAHGSGDVPAEMRCEQS